MWKCPKCGRELRNINEDHNCGERPKTIDAYIYAQPEDIQQILKQVRYTLRNALPFAEERISWRMPTYWHKQNIIHFAAFKKHVGLYPGDEAIEHFRERITNYKTSKGAVQFPYSKPLPLPLIAEIAQWCYDTGESSRNSEVQMRPIATEYSMEKANMNKEARELLLQQREDLLKIVKNRFEKNMHRHPNCAWNEIQARLEADTKKLWSLLQMEVTGGEPDVVGFDDKTSEYIFYDCSEESPKGRRSLCYDREALLSRKANKPENNAVDMAAFMGVALLTEEQYRDLQRLGRFDTKTSSWVDTPSHIRKLGGALFCDRRYDTVFVYHNGAESYYAARGFRASLRI